MSISRLMDGLIFLLLLAALWSIDTIAGAGSNPLEIFRYGVICSLEGTILVLVIIESVRRPVVLHLSVGGALLVVFFAYTAISVFWSAGGMQSVLKDILLAVTVGTALAIAALRPTRVLVQSAIAACGAIVVIGVIVVFVAPGVGIESGWGLEGKWRGISIQKNNFGGLVALSLVYTVIQLVIAPPTGRRRGVTLLTLLWAGFLSICLLMSGSRGAQLATAIGLVALGFTRLRRGTQNVVLLIVGLLAIPIAILAAVSFSADSTHLSVAGLTFDTSSRTQIWNYGLQNLGSRMLFGFGPSGFWTPERLRVFLANNGWVLDNFHSGYVTVLMEGGLVGAGLLVAALVGCFSWLRRLPLAADRHLTFAMCFFGISVAENLVENILGRSTDFLFMLFVLLMISANTVPALLRAVDGANALGTTRGAPAVSRRSRGPARPDTTLSTEWPNG